jgi:hypothetical protein
MSLAELDNLTRIRQFKAEPRNDVEVRRVLSMARSRLADAQLVSLSPVGRFISAYNAAHAAALGYELYRLTDDEIRVVEAGVA